MKEDYPPDVKRKPKDPPLVAVVAREGFRAPNRLADVVKASHRFREDIIDLKVGVNEGRPDTKRRDVVGMKIREWERNGGFWRVQVLNALLFEAMETLEAWPEAETNSQGKGSPPYVYSRLFANISQNETPSCMAGRFSSTTSSSWTSLMRLH